MITFVQYHNNPNSMKFEMNFINAVIVGIVVQCISSSILLTIFVKIYTVVKDRDEDNVEELESFDDGELSYRPSNPTSMNSIFEEDEEITVIDQIRKSNGLENGILGALAN